MTQLEQSFSYIERELRLMSKDQFGGFDNAIYVDKVIDDITKIPNFCTGVFSSINSLAYIAKTVNGPSGSLLLKLFNISLHNTRVELVMLLAEASRLKKSNKKNERKAFVYLAKLYKMSIRQIMSIIINIKTTNPYTELSNMLKHKSKFKLRFDQFDRLYAEDESDYFDDEDSEEIIEDSTESIEDIIQKLSSILGRDLSAEEKLRVLNKYTQNNMSDDDDEDEDEEDRILEMQSLAYLASQPDVSTPESAGEYESFEEFIKKNNVEGYEFDESPKDNSEKASEKVDEKSGDDIQAETQTELGDNWETFNTRDPEDEEPFVQVDPTTNSSEMNDTAPQNNTNNKDNSTVIDENPTSDIQEKIEDGVEKLYDGVDYDQIHDPELLKIIGQGENGATKEYLEERELVKNVRQFTSAIERLIEAPKEDQSVNNGIQKFYVNDPNEIQEKPEVATEAMAEVPIDISDDQNNDTIVIPDEDVEVISTDSEEHYEEEDIFNEIYEYLKNYSFDKLKEKITKFFAEENLVELQDINVTIVPSYKLDKLITLCVDIHITGNNEISEPRKLYHYADMAAYPIMDYMDISTDFIDVEINTYINDKKFNFELAEFYENSAYNKQDITTESIHMRNVYACAILFFIMKYQHNLKCSFNKTDIKIMYTFLPNSEDIMIYWTKDTPMPEKLHEYLQEIITKAKCADNHLIYCLNQTAVMAYKNIICRTLNQMSIKDILQQGGEFWQDFIVGCYQNPTAVRIRFDIDPNNDLGNINIIYETRVDNPIEKSDLYDIREEFEHHGLFGHNLRTVLRVISPWITPIANYELSWEGSDSDNNENADQTTPAESTTNAFNL